jgi:hypothetical protein
MLDNSGTNAHTAANSRAVYNGHHHPVPGVQGGGDTVNSNTPNQPL